MTDAQRLTIKASEQRSRLAELAALDDVTDERAELDTLTSAHQDTERQLRAAIAAEGDAARVDAGPEVDPEVRERMELRGRANVGAFVAAALSGRMPDGAEAEYAAACKVPGGYIPLDAFEVDRPAEQRSATEQRAITPAPGTGTGVTVAPVLPFVFAPSIAPLLGVDMPSVGSGSYSELTVSTALVVNPEAKGDAADGTAAALTAVTANPRRISARLSLAVEDIANVGQANFEAALRAHVSMALSNSLDNQIINGNGTSPNINGLINQLTDPTNPTAVASFDSFVTSFADSIDGLWASMMSDVAIITNVDAYKLAAKTFRGTAANGGSALTFADYAKVATGGFRTNKRMPATASTIARGIVHRMGRMGLRTACLPAWGSISIDDIYTDSASGVHHFTMHSLVGDKVLLVQPEAYGLVEYKVSA